MVYTNFILKMPVCYLQKIGHSSELVKNKLFVVCFLFNIESMKAKSNFVINTLVEIYSFNNNKILKQTCVDDILSQ